ncbi:Type I restriction modification DNA specificity domain protein [uncultured archaeon]|nr:Type I restriction modification DNA specificity domain protein [uncultured archaeon]
MTSAASSWKPYPAYKDSGVEWMGKVPEGWKLQKLKNIVKVNLSNVDKKTIEGEDTVKLCNYLDVYYNDYITPNLDFMEATASPDQIDKFALKEGDVIITKDSESWEDIAVPAYVPHDLDGVICGYHLAHIRPNNLDIDGEYLFWSFCAPQQNHQFRVEAHGITRFGIGKYSIDNSIFLVPPLNDQKYIARFLDDRTRKIDFLIEKKQKLIELLKEERAAVINPGCHKRARPARADEGFGGGVAGGGAGREVKKLKHIAVLKSGDFINAENIKPTGDFPVLGGNGLRGYTNTNTHEGNYILIGRQGALCGNINLVAGKFYATEHAVVVTIPDKSNTIWLAELLRSMNLNQYSQASAQPGLAIETIKNLFIPFPPYKAQKEIVSLINSETSRIDRAASTIEKEIALLQEYRTALISEVVTGKIDVLGE